MQKKVLIAEDDPLIADSLKLCLQEQGYEVVSIVAQGEDVLKAFQDHDPHVILMDIRLRGKMDGIAAIQSVRRHSHVPVIYMTGWLSPQTVEVLRDTIPYDSIIKPFDIEELVEKIERLSG